MKLDRAAIDAGVRLEAFDTLVSTNAEALARAASGERGPLWITANRQTAGRGRRGRTWVSEPGNLFATLLLTDPAPPSRAAELSFVAALAVRDAIVALARAELAPAMAARIDLKWPNDVLIDGAKVCGILLEGESGPPLAVAVGIGVNCTCHPDAALYPATDLSAAAIAAGPAELFGALSRAMLARLAQWASGDGFAGIRADWLAHAHGLGGGMRVTVDMRTIEGCFETLDESGRLVLRGPDGPITLAAGDVFPLSVAAAAAEHA